MRQQFAILFIKYFGNKNLFITLIKRVIEAFFERKAFIFIYLINNIQKTVLLQYIILPFLNSLSKIIIVLTSFKYLKLNKRN